MSKEQTGTGMLSYLYVACIIIMTSTFICGCGQFQITSTFKEANEYSGQGSYIASLNK